LARYPERGIDVGLWLAIARTTREKRLRRTKTDGEERANFIMAAAEEAGVIRDLIDQQRWRTPLGILPSI
jgi:hypothetical protein